jgi:hypothetical protein
VWERIELPQPPGFSWQEETGRVSNKVMPVHSLDVADYNPYTSHILGSHHKAYSGIVRVESMVFTSMRPPLTGQFRTGWLAEHIIPTLARLPMLPPMLSNTVL